MNELVVKSLEGLPFFTKSALLQAERVNDNALNQNIKRWVRRGLLMRLKNGLFVTKTFLDRSLAKTAYIELCAGRLLFPSYVSLEYVLQKNHLLTEATFSITSVTTKSGRTFINPIGTFVYHTVKQELYFGFEKNRFGKNAYYSAILVKALFDFLYLRLSQLDPRDPGTIDALRLNWDLVTQPVFDALCEMIRRSRIKKLQEILRVIAGEFHGHAH